MRNESQTFKRISPRGKAQMIPVKEHGLLQSNSQTNSQKFLTAKEA
jgi:hypothetical protein